MDQQYPSGGGGGGLTWWTEIFSVAVRNNIFTSENINVAMVIIAPFTAKVKCFGISSVMINRTLNGR